MSSVRLPPVELKELTFFVVSVLFDSVVRRTARHVKGDKKFFFFSWKLSLAVPVGGRVSVPVMGSRDLRNIRRA